MPVDVKAMPTASTNKILSQSSPSNVKKCLLVYSFIMLQSASEPGPCQNGLETS